MSDRSLAALINDEHIGTLRESNGLWSFQYTEAWLRHTDRFSLSPHLPLGIGPIVDQGSQRPVQWYFDNLLPEEGQRTLLAKDAKLEYADAFGLLAFYGAESAGSVTLLPENGQNQATEEWRPLSDATLSKRIRQMPHVPLAQNAIKRMSLAGAQHKLAVVMANGQLFEPAGAAPSTHILKPDHPDKDYAHSVANEWFVMQLAKRLGLDVPPVYRRYVPEPVYLIERFDRIKKNEQSWQRQHVIDACQLLGLDRQFKYQQGSMENLGKLAEACRSKALARTRLFEWLVFNLLVGNNDAHLKNLSFLVRADGDIQLAPHYDLLSTASYESRAYEKTNWPENSTLSWPICGIKFFSEINRNVLIDAGSILGLNKITAERFIEKLRSNITPISEALYAEFETENAQLKAEKPDLALTLAGEERCVRVINRTVISEMVGRLQ
jgi:serine/threonine-protein kinase HipA